MRLVNPGTGEVSDRLTILALKILAGRQAQQDVAHFETERTTLLQKIHARTLNAMWFDALLELAAVNGLLWHAEDDLRGWRDQAEGKIEDCDQAAQEEIGGIAFRIQHLNDKRAELVRQINRDAGDAADREKL